MEADVVYEYPTQKKGTLVLSYWDIETEQWVKREPATEAERIKALEQIVLELHAKIKRLSE